MQTLIIDIFQLQWFTRPILKTLTRSWTLWGIFRLIVGNGKLEDLKTAVIQYFYAPCTCVILVTCFMTANQEQCNTSFVHVYQQLG